MRKINKIIIIVVIFTLTGMAVYQEAYCLRVPIADTKRKEEVLEEAARIKYAEALRSLRHHLDNLMAALTAFIDLLFYNVDHDTKGKILERLGEIYYPNNMKMDYHQAREIFSKTNNPTEYIWEAERTMQFYKNIFSKVSEFTFFSDEELEDFPSELRSDKKEIMQDIKDKCCKEFIENTKDFELRARGERYIKEIKLAEWCEAYLKSVIQAYPVLAKDVIMPLDIELFIDIPDDLVFSADEYELKQIFWNLSLNSIRAMEKDAIDKPIIKITAKKQLRH